MEARRLVVENSPLCLAPWVRELGGLLCLNDGVYSIARLERMSLKLTSPNHKTTQEQWKNTTIEARFLASPAFVIIGRPEETDSVRNYITRPNLAGSRSFLFRCARKSDSVGNPPGSLPDVSGNSSDATADIVG